MSCAGGNYDQYDTIAYPCEAIISNGIVMNSQDKARNDSSRIWLFPTAIKGFVEKVWSKVSGSSEGQKALSHIDEHTYSLYVYIKPYTEALCNGTYTSNIVEMADEIKHIYTLMSSVIIMNKKGMKTEPLQLTQVNI